MIADLPKQLELRFWDLALPVMSKNRFLQKVICTSYRIVMDSELRQRSLVIIIGSILGFVAGLLVFAAIV